MNELAPSQPNRPNVLKAFLGTLQPNTAECYKRDLTAFATHLQLADIIALVALLIGGVTQGRANELVFDYREAMLRSGLAAATINRRLAAIRSLIKMGRVLGAIGWTIDVPSVRAQPYRDTKGPSTKVYQRLISRLTARRDPKGKRDLAIVRLLHDVVLRRAEVASLDLKHWDRDNSRIAVLRKKKRERVWITLPATTGSALDHWILMRGDFEGPLFVSLDKGALTRSPEDRRLSTGSIYEIVKALGDQLGVALRPHGLRHLGITEALEKTGGDVRKVARFSGHEDVRTLQIYDDARRDSAGEVADLVAGDSEPDPDSGEESDALET